MCVQQKRILATRKKKSKFIKDGDYSPLHLDVACTLFNGSVTLAVTLSVMVTIPAHWPQWSKISLSSTNYNLGQRYGFYFSV